MTNVCRTCGFSDCPGANGGNCPRWPARDISDLDALTRQELYALHNDLFNEHSALNSKLIGPDYKPLVDPLGEFWQEIDTQCREVAAKMAQVHALIQVREAERDRHQETVLAEAIYRGFSGAPANADGADHERPMPDLEQSRIDDYTLAMRYEEAADRPCDLDA